MRRALWVRVLAAFLAFWVPLSVGEPSALGLCPAHDAAAAPSAATDSHHDHAAAVSDAATQHHAPSPDGTHQCACIAGCSISAVATVVPDAPVTAVIAIAHETSGFSATAPVRARPAPDFVLPHPTGPPRV